MPLQSAAGNIEIELLGRGDELAEFRAEAIAAVDANGTVADLTDRLRELGDRRGLAVHVHQVTLGPWARVHVAYYEPSAVDELRAMD